MDRFPPEVLCAFFVLIKQFVSSKRHRSGAARVNAEIKALIELSGVCRHWRRVILGDGTLWTNIPVDTARPGCGKLLRSTLERSKQSTVSVNASVFLSTTNEEMIEDVLKVIAGSSSRIGELVLETDSSPFLERWTFPATVLRKLRISNRGPCAPLTTMFGDQVPQLESLTLSGFTVCPAAFLGGLKHLTLKLPPTYTPVFMTTVVDLLAAAPNVESLSLTSFLPVLDSCPPSFKVTLPQLRDALLRRCDAVSILQHLVVPKEAELHISVDHRTLGLGVDLRAADSHILLALPPSPEADTFLPRSPKLVIETNETLSGFAVALTDAGSTRPHLKISECSGRIPLDFVRRSLEAISSHAYFKTAKNVTLSVPPTIPGILWSSWFEKFALATQLGVRALPAEVVFCALMRTDEGGLPVCPRLKHVAFYGAGSSAVLVDSRSITKLFLFRAATGFPLEKVTATERGVVKGFKQPALLGHLLGSQVDQLR